MQTAKSSLDDLVVCYYHEGSMTRRDWLVIQVDDMACHPKSSLCYNVL